MIKFNINTFIFLSLSLSLSLNIRVSFADLANPLNTSTQNSIVLNSAAESPLTTTTNDGFLNVLANRLFKKIGYNLIVEKLPAERALRSANNGLIDGEIIRVAGMEKIYPNLIRVPEKMMVMSFVAFSKKQSNLSSGWSALANKEVAFITGWKIYELKVPKTTSITKTKDSKELFTLLQKNRIDIVLYNRWAGFFMIDKMQLKDVHIQLPELANKDMYLYLHKKHKALVPQINNALKLMKQNGGYQKLVDKHLKPLE